MKTMNNNYLYTNKLGDIQCVSVMDVVVNNVKIVDVVVRQYIMNQQDRKEFDIIHLKIDGMKEDITELRKEMDVAHKRTGESLSFIKENLFNPHEGLWAETKQNSQFRDDSKKWRFPIGVGFISLVIKNIWDSITS